jgi:cytosine/uracil/thiamine/allantoin permease
VVKVLGALMAIGCFWLLGWLFGWVIALLVFIVLCAMATLDYLQTR